MRYALVSASLLTALVLIGCGDSKRAVPTGTPVAEAEFCNELVDALCDSAVRCDCSPTADADCRADLASTCGGAGGIFGPEIHARVAAGTVVYSPTAAGAVIARLRAQTTCDNPILDVGWGFDDVLTFGGTLTGTLAPGASCTTGTGSSPFGGECANGVCTDVGGTPRCIGFAALGDACGMGIDKICVDLDAAFTSLDDANILLRCNVAPPATTGTCTALLANGAPCADRQECASSRCEGSVCAATLTNGDTCGSNRDCSSGFCRSSGAMSVCAAAGTVSNGGVCTADGDCASGACKADVCAPGVCDVYSAPAPAPMPAI